MENNRPIHPCPLCERPLEEPFKGLLSCYHCMINVNPETGETIRIKSQKGIIKKLTDKLKSFLWM